jgi:dipeptidyl-peptidase-4
MRAAVLVLISLAFTPALIAADAPREKLTLEVLFSPDPQQKVDFSGKRVAGLSWLDDDHFLEIRNDVWQVVSVKTGSASTLYDRRALETAAAKLAGLTAEDAAALTSAKSLTLAPDHQSALVNHNHDLFFVGFKPARVVRLTADPAPEVGEELSPNGRLVSFIRGHDIYLVDIDTQRERRLTHGGSEELLFGRLDWVYQEELYGRGNFKGYWWSPDSSRIAFLRLDESPVLEFTVVDHLPSRLELEVTNYPKAGDPNPVATLGVIPAGGGDITWIDTRRWQAEEHLIVRVGWRPDSSRVVYQVQDREQTRLELADADPRTGASTVLLRETTPAWVEVLGEPLWLDDGGFLWLSDHSGNRHVSRHAADGSLVAALTTGDFEVRDLLAVDGKSKALFFSSTERDPIGLDVWAIGLDGTAKRRISERSGTHTAIFNPSATRFLDTWSDFSTPPQVRLHGADGRELRVIEANPVESLSRYQWAQLERLQIPARDGFPMEAVILKPADFDPAKRYPVIQHTYAGPYAPIVRDAWDRRGRNLWHHYLASEGFVVVLADNRSASGKGMKHVWPIHGRMGEGELRDLEDVAAWIKAQPWAEPDRLGLWGWSYGGYITGYALTRSTAWAAGIVGAPVVHWELYDTIYTERYMRRPQNNPEGYASSSVEGAAAGLQGKLLLIHGTMDDNVHLQQSIRLVDALQKAGKDFELMLYPKSRHGVTDPARVYHLQRTMTDFFVRHLRE